MIIKAPVNISYVPSVTADTVTVNQALTSPQVTADTVTVNNGFTQLTTQAFQITTFDPPQTLTDPGNPGEIRIDKYAIYVCVAPNHWRYVLLT